MGHQIDPLGYNKAMRDVSYVRKEYRNAEKWLNIISENPEFIRVDEVDELKEKIVEDYEKRISELEEFKMEILRTLKLNVEIEKLSEK